MATFVYPPTADTFSKYKLTPSDWRATTERTGFLPVTNETVVGFNNLLNIAWLNRGLQLSRAVGRISTPYGRGTGFLIGPDVLLTNCHVLENPDQARNAVVEFNYQNDWSGRLEPTQTFQLDPTKFRTNEKLDYTIVRVQGNPGLIFGYIDLKDLRTPTVNDYLSIIQHPQGGPKQIALTDNKVAAVFGHYVQYTTDTEPGSSGSPVFDQYWNLVALHHKGGALPGPDGRVVFINQGVAITKIVRDARRFLGMPDELYTVGFEDLRSELTYVINTGPKVETIPYIASSLMSRYTRFPIALRNWTNTNDLEWKATDAVPPDEILPFLAAAAGGIAIGASIRHWARKSGRESIGDLESIPSIVTLDPDFVKKVSALKGTPQLPVEVYAQVLGFVTATPSVLRPLREKFEYKDKTTEAFPAIVAVFLAGVIAGARAYSGR